LPLLVLGNSESLIVFLQSVVIVPLVATYWGLLCATILFDESGFEPGGSSMTIPQADEVAIKDVIVSLRSYWNRHDMQAFSQLFTQDADFVNVIGAWWKGRPEIRQAHEDSHATMFKDSTLSILETSVRFLKPDVAVARTRWELVGMISPQGEMVPPRNGIWTNVLVKEDGRWAIVASQNTDIVPIEQLGQG
jgi:uncharacterized protein (TIGR02246 family)